MSQIRNVSGEPLTVPVLGGRLVLPGAIVELDPADVYGFTQQSLWEAADESAEAAHVQGEADYFDRLRADGQAVPGDEPGSPAVAIPDGEPTDKWTVAQLVAYADRHGIDLGGATRKNDLLTVINDNLES